MKAVGASADRGRKRARLRTRRWRSRYRVLLGLARAALFWERLWPRLWPLLAVAGVFLSVALLDVLPRLAVWLHALVLAGFAASAVIALVSARRALGPVSRARARRRLERDSGLAHRPLTALEDRPFAAKGDATAGLWRVHVSRAAEAARRLRLAPPAPGLARHDPYGLRAAVVLLLVVAAVAGRGDAEARIWRALHPALGAEPGAAVRLELWITPPAYTGHAPLFLEAVPGEPASTEATPVHVPVGSALLGQLSGGREPPRLVVGDETVPFDAMGSGAFRVEAAIDGGERLAVERSGEVLADWPMRVIADAPPAVTFKTPPAAVGRARTRLEVEATDDYGVDEVWAEIRHPKGLSVPAGEATVRLDLPLPGLGAPKVEGAAVRDLSAHPWAGLEVMVQARARDGRGQIGDGEVVAFTLPERVFHHPVARAIIEERRKLVAPSPKIVAEVGAALNGISGRPESFNHDTVAFLVLRVALARLIHDGGIEAVASVIDLLWDTALRIEDGELSIAERELRDIRERLEKALRDGRDAEELERLMDELQQALEAYLMALAERLEREEPGEFLLGSDMRIIEGRDLSQMIEEARELMRSGALEAAREMLAQLQRMLEGIQAGLEAGAGREDMSKARALMDALRALTERQRQLLDQTFRWSQRNAEGGRRPGETDPRPGTPGDGRPRDHGAGEQDLVRRLLGDLMLEMDAFIGSIPDPLGKAERSMRDAVEALREGNLNMALPSQTEALEQMRRATDAISEQMARRFGGRAGFVAGSRGRRTGEADPFGRTPGGAFGTTVDGLTKVPDRMERMRARDIMRELRRRSGEHHRPPHELDYIERLLDRY